MIEESALINSRTTERSTVAKHRIFQQTQMAQILILGFLKDVVTARRQRIAAWLIRSWAVMILPSFMEVPAVEGQGRRKSTESDSKITNG
jgi:hypothetical protein